MLLALDTATTTASLALYDLDAAPRGLPLLAELTWQARRRHTQDTLAALDFLLAQQELTPADLTACAVTTGPGSFTGVRIGVSLVKGLALGSDGDGRGLRVVGVPTLSVTAAPWLPLLEGESRLCAYIQAGRGRYNWTWFAAGDTLRRPTPDEHFSGDAATFAAAVETASAEEGAAHPVWLAGETDAELAAAFARVERVRLLDETTALRRAGHLARFAARLLAQGGQDAAQELAALKPLYLAPA